MSVKKTFYFTQQNKREKEIKWLSIVQEIRGYQKMKFQIEKAALLILDMQNLFLESHSHAYVPSVVTIIPHIKKLIHFFTEQDQPIIFTRQLFNIDPKDKMRRWWKDPIDEKDDLSKIHQIFPVSSYELIIKHQYSAFFNTNLHSYLKKNHITQLIITGVMTHLCCETSARDGFMHGYDIWFPINTSATYNENFHIGSLCTITHGFGECNRYETLIS